MIKETDGDDFKSMRSINQKLSFIKAKEQFEKSGIQFGENKMLSLGIKTTNEIYTNVGLLLPEQCPSLIKLACFKGKDIKEFQDCREFTG